MLGQARVRHRTEIDFDTLQAKIADVRVLQATSRSATVQANTCGGRFAA